MYKRQYLYLIFYDAFNADYYSGNSALGGVLGALIILGIRRGAFSNEAGIGMAQWHMALQKQITLLKRALLLC